MNAINWTAQTDGADNTYWEGRSPYYVDEDLRFNWRIRQRLFGNKVTWYEDHDAEIADPNESNEFETETEAKEHVQKLHDRTIETLQRESR